MRDLARRFQWSGQDLASLTAFFLGLTAVFATRPAASYKAIELGASTFEVGVVGGSFAVLALVAAIPIGLKIDGAGERRYFLAGAALLAVACLIEWRASSLIVLMVGQAVLGLGQVNVGISMQSLAANRASPPMADQRFARVAVGASLGQLLGPTISGLAIGTSQDGVPRQGGLALAYAISGLIALSAAAIVLLWVRSSEQPVDRPPRQRTTTQIWSLLKQPGVLVALTASLAVLTTIDILVAYLPLLGEERGLAPAFVGLLLSLRAGAGLASRLSLPAMLRRLGRRRVLYLMLLTAGAGLVVLPLVPAQWMMAVAIMAIGFGLGVGAPMTLAWMSASARPGERGSALGVRMTTNRAGQMLVPSLLGALALSLGSMVIFFAGAVGLVASAIWVQRSELDADRAD